MIVNPANTRATPTPCIAERRSSNSNAPLASPDTGISSAKGEMSGDG